MCFELSSDYSASGIGIPGRNPELVRNCVLPVNYLFLLNLSSSNLRKQNT